MKAAFRRQTAGDDRPARWIADGDKSISPPTVTSRRHAPAIRPAFSVRLSSVCIKYHAAMSAPTRYQLCEWGGAAVKDEPRRAGFDSDN